jgi:hypothetical protein
MPKIEVSVGELVDKITILEIKKDRIKDETKLCYIKEELEILKGDMEKYDFPLELYERLLEINTELWDTEDIIRSMEDNLTFGDEFIKHARLDAILNDKRFLVKNEINSISKSAIKEQKSYEGLYTAN